MFPPGDSHLEPNEFVVLQDSVNPKKSAFGWIKNGKIVSVSAGGAEFAAENVIIAAGHSARDTFAMLREKGVLMEAKPFSVFALRATP